MASSGEVSPPLQATSPPSADSRVPRVTAFSRWGRHIAYRWVPDVAQNRDLAMEPMTYEILSLLRSLATRPSRNIAATVQPMVDELVKAGYIVNEEGSGWSATAEGCRVIESTRASPLLFA
jgi:hypothetical protein